MDHIARVAAPKIVVSAKGGRSIRRMDPVARVAAPKIVASAKGVRCGVCYSGLLMPVSEAAKFVAMVVEPSFSRRGRADTAGIGCAKLATIQKPRQGRAAVECSALDTASGAAPVDTPPLSPDRIQFLERQKGIVKFRPCIDIHKGKVKQIVGSTLSDLPDGEGSSDLSTTAAALVTNFESETSAADFARMYKDDGLWGGHVIMLGADPASQAAALSALAAYPGGLQLGGGVNPDNAKTYLDAGASHVIVTSYVFSQGQMKSERLKSLVHIVGKDKLVLDLSCRKKDGQYFVVTDRWQRFSNLVVNEETLVSLSASADEFLVHGVDVEGKRLGIDVELVRLLGKWSPIPVTYAGGARSLDDLECIKDAGLGAVDVTVGSALDVFGGALPYQEVVQWHKYQQRQ